MNNQHNQLNVEEHGLKQHNLGVWTVVFMIFCLCAAGCYGIEEMIPACGPGLTMIILIVLPFVWSTPMGLVASELGSARPQEGGLYKWVQEALGEFWGFQASWWRNVSVYIDNTLYVILAGGYVASQWDLTWGAETAVKLAMIFIFTYINIRGVKDVGIVSNVLSILVIVAFAMVAICGFINANTNAFEPITADGEIMGFRGIGAGDWIYYIGSGIATGMWMYCGYDSMSTIAGEIKNPMVIPKATMITVPLIMLAYIFPTWGALTAMDTGAVTEILGADALKEAGAEFGWQMWGTEPGYVGYADVVTHYWGASFGVFFVIVAVLAQCSIYNTYIASGSRGFFALAEDYLAPPILTKCDKKHGVPYIAVLSVAVVNIILCQFAFSTVVVVDMFMLMSAYILIFVSALVLRKKIPAEEYKFRIPGGYKALVVICMMPIMVAVIAYFINGTENFIGGAIGIVSGPIMYVIWKVKYGGLAKKDSAKYPINEKTKLAIGDTKRLSFMFLILSIMCAVAVPWLRWFEGDWAEEYYLEEYGSGFFSNFEGMLSAIWITAIVFAVITIILYIISRKVEPKKIESK